MSGAILDHRRPLAWLARCPVYRPTPLVHHVVHGRRVWIKDETDRMGLGSFKALGGIYAVAALMMDVFGLEEPMPLVAMTDGVRHDASAVTFVCASAGNHGLAVATGARLFGAQCRVHLSTQVDVAFTARLRAIGATVIRSGATYDESVAAAIDDAAQSGALHLADGSWPGYVEPPRLVMEGYTVLAEEIADRLRDDGSWPTHVFLQAGVGGMAAAVAATIRRRWPRQPEIIVVEPDAAPCIRASVKAGRTITVSGPTSAMGRLDCKVPSFLALEILREAADRFVTISDPEATEAVAIARDMGYATTPSGVAGLAALLTAPNAPPNALIILTEGALS